MENRCVDKERCLVIFHSASSAVFLSLSGFAFALFIFLYNYLFFEFLIEILKFIGDASKIENIASKSPLFGWMWALLFLFLSIIPNVLIFFISLRIFSNHRSASEHALEKYLAIVIFIAVFIYGYLDILLQHVNTTPLLTHSITCLTCQMKIEFINLAYLFIAPFFLGWLFGKIRTIERSILLFVPHSCSIKKPKHLNN